MVSFTWLVLMWKNNPWKGTSGWSIQEVGTASVAASPGLSREVVVVVASCSRVGVLRLCLGCCLGVLATRSPGTRIGPFPCRFSGTPWCLVYSALLIDFEWGLSWGSRWWSLSICSGSFPDQWSLLFLLLAFILQFRTSGKDTFNSSNLWAISLHIYTK